MAEAPEPPGAIARGGARLLRNRRLVRAPIRIYQARLGFLFGTRLLMLEHIGRTSGLRRHVVLEVVGRPTARTFVVVSGFGTRSQWYRNLRVHPRVRVWVGARGPAPATARRLTPAEADLALADYQRRHRRAWRRLKPILEATLGAPIDGGRADLPVIELTLDPPAGRAGHA